MQDNKIYSIKNYCDNWCPHWYPHFHCIEGKVEVLTYYPNYQEIQEKKEMTHYYSRESTTQKGQFTIMEVIPGKSERLVCRTPRGDVAAHLVTSLNRQPLPVTKRQCKIGDRFYSAAGRTAANEHMLISVNDEVRVLSLARGTSSPVWRLEDAQRYFDDGTWTFKDK